VLSALGVATHYTTIVPEVTRAIVFEPVGGRVRGKSCCQFSTSILNPTFAFFRACYLIRRRYLTFIMCIMNYLE
jgi:hypothetical protein